MRLCVDLADDEIHKIGGSDPVIGFRVGEKYLVFAGMRDGKLFTGNCSRTKRVEYAQEDLQQLGVPLVVPKSFEWRR